MENLCLKSKNVKRMNTNDSLYMGGYLRREANILQVKDRCMLEETPQRRLISAIWTKILILSSELIFHGAHIFRSDVTTLSYQKTLRITPEL